MKSTHDILKELKAAGLSQLAISRKTGIKQPSLSRWGAGDVPVAADGALKLAGLLAEVQQAQCVTTDLCSRSTSGSEFSQSSIVSE